MAKEKVSVQVPEAVEAEEVSGRALLKMKTNLQEAFKPTSSAAAEAVEKGVRALAQEAAKGFIAIDDDVADTIKQYIQRIDAALTKQINSIIHHEEFKKLESAWRGLHYLCSNTNTDAKLQIKVLNITKREAGTTLKKYAGAKMDQSPLFRKIYEKGFGTLRGNPFGCIVGDYYFDPSNTDIDFLREMSKIASAAHCPFIAGASPKMFDVETFSEITAKPDIGEIFNLPHFSGWRALRESEDSQYLGLAMPRFLARLPYGQATEPVEEFAFEEDVKGKDHEKYAWANSAYAMAANITRSFKEFGWCSRIRGVESGGAVRNLPMHTFTADDGGVDIKSPTEIDITIRRENELAKAGFMPLSHAQNENFAAFIGAQSVHKPRQYDDADASASAALGARLPYLFAVCRFAHYLQKMVYEKVGIFTGREEIESDLNNWLNKNYVLREAHQASELERAKRPLSDATVMVEEDPENPGYYTSKFLLRPHFQLEGMSVSLRLVARVPTNK